MEKLRLSKKDIDMFLRIGQCEKFNDGKQDYYNFVVSVTDRMFIKTKFFNNLEESKNYLVNTEDFCNVSLSYKKDDSLLNENKKGDLILDFEWQDTFPYKEVQLVGRGADIIREMVERDIYIYEQNEELDLENNLLFI